MRRLVVGTCAPLALFAAVFFSAPRPAAALPSFALDTGLACNACHTGFRAINGLGKLYLRRGYRFPNLGIHAEPIVTLRGVAVARSRTGDGLPPVILDDLEALLAARVAPNVNAVVDAYAVDAGRPASLREAWVRFASGTTTPWNLTLGRQSLALPVDPESMRPTRTPYAVFDLGVGDNGFSLAQAKDGLSLAIGSPVRGASLNALIATGHDPASGLPARGFDTMLGARVANGGITLGAFTYRGTRPLVTGDDAFRRDALWLDVYRGRLAFESLVARGSDRLADGAIGSTGSYVQVRYAASSRLEAVARLDAMSYGFGEAVHGLVTGVRWEVVPGLRLGLERASHGIAGPPVWLGSLGFGISNTKMGSAGY